MPNPLIGRGWHFPPLLDPRGAVALTGDEDEIEQAVQIILRTAPGQRLMRPDFGCRIFELVFAPNNDATAALAARYVSEALGQWEPRIRLEKVEAAVDPNCEGRLQIFVDYRVLATHSNRSLVYPFYLIPDESAQRE